MQARYSGRSRREHRTLFFSETGTRSGLCLTNATILCVNRYVPFVCQKVDLLYFPVYPGPLSRELTNSLAFHCLTQYTAHTPLREGQKTVLLNALATLQASKGRGRLPAQPVDVARAGHNPLGLEVELRRSLFGKYLRPLRRSRRQGQSWTFPRTRLKGRGQGSFGLS